MVIRRGDIWWAQLGEPRRSEPGFERPVLVVQSDAFNRSRIQTVIAVVITSNTRLAEAPGNVLLSKAASGLPKPAVANISQIITLDRSFLERRVRRLRKDEFTRVQAGLKLVLALGSLPGL